MITVVQLRVLRKMLETHTVLTNFGQAGFRGSSGDVRKQTLISLEKKGFIEGNKGPFATEYRITDKGREAIGETVPTLVGKLVKEALDHLAVIQDIAEKSYVIDRVMDILTIRERADEALRILLAADVILSEGVP